MSEEFIKEAKNFKRQMKWCAIISWIATAFLSYKASDKIDAFVLPLFLSSAVEI